MSSASLLIRPSAATRTEQVLALARKRDSSMKGGTRLVIDANRPLRHTMEIRNSSYIDATFIVLLRKYHVALVVADTAEKRPYCEDVTSDFMCLRLHGDKGRYVSGYNEEALDRWAMRRHKSAGARRY